MDTRTLVMLVSQGSDGRIYPAKQLSAAELDRLATLVHRLHCTDHLSYRKTQQVLLDRFGIRRSRGAIGQYLAGWTCPDCPKPPAGPGRVVITPR